MLKIRLIFGDYEKAVENKPLLNSLFSAVKKMPQKIMPLIFSNHFPVRYK
jgi:hypothetical protein